MNLTPDISKKDQIAQYIRGRIRNNYYPAGKRLESVRRLADEFNVSLKIVTDALADLEMEGLVRREETLPGSSAVIISVLFSMVIICEAMNPKSPFSAKRACP